MDAPSPDMMPDSVTLRAANNPSGRSPNYAEPGIALAANVAAISSPADQVIAEQGVAKLRCRVMVYSNPDLTDPKGVVRKLRKADGVMWQGVLWIAAGPMTPEAKGPDGVPVCYRFEMELTD